MLFYDARWILVHKIRESVLCLSRDGFDFDCIHDVCLDEISIACALVSSRSDRDSVRTVPSRRDQAATF